MPSHTLIEEIDDSLEQYSVSQLYDELLRRHAQNAKSLLASTFAHLNKETQFFKDPEASKVLARLLRDVNGSAAKKTPISSPAKPSSVFEANGASKATKIEKPLSPPSVPVKASNSQPIASSSKPSVDEDNDENDSESKPKGLRPNKGNGADLNTFSWTQTLSEVCILVPVPEGSRAKDCFVDITASSIKVGVKGSNPIIKGELSKPVQSDETLWSLDKSVIEITLSKKDRQNWWNSIIAGQDVIDTSKVEPETSKLSDLDGETRATVEKMMFDQRQKQMGLPTSEDSQKQDMLKKFMAAHPEMDFSNAKIS